LAYGQQITKAINGRSSTEGLSRGTWALLLASNACAVAYAIEQGDWIAPSLLVANVLGCGMILMIAGSKGSEETIDKAWRPD
jgi:hypothetical protein